VPRIYTKAGDAGQTGLFGGERVSKDDLRVEAYGSVDELNAAIGLARSLGSDAEMDQHLARIQEELFCIGSDLATPPGAKARAALPKVEPAWAEALEKAIDGWEAALPALSQFLLPGGSAGGAALHVARSACRRAERRVVALHARAPVGAVLLAYLNRLSDFLFVAARVANRRANAPEALWDPRRER
jgi:cob(I)alamin adenosyltransferase